MVEKKVFMDSRNRATFVCPKCEKASIMDVSQYRDIDKAVKVRCRCVCGHNYMVLLERRMYYRKETDLPGTYIRPSDGKSREMTVKNLSRTGLNLEGATADDLPMGETIHLRFELTDGSTIERDGVVRTVSGSRIGVEFVTPLDLSPLDVA